MKYPKDAYHENSHLVSQKKSGSQIFDEGFLEMIPLLNDKSIFEVGFDFGQRLLKLQEEGIKVIGGVEFDPNFGLYKKHSNLFDHGWDIRFVQIDSWNPINRECVITNHFLDKFNEEDRLVLLEKLKNTSEELYLNEDCELDLPKEGNVYVYANVGRDDLESPPETNEFKQIELPDLKSLKDRLEAAMGNEEDTRED